MKGFKVVILLGVLLIAGVLSVFANEYLISQQKELVLLESQLNELQQKKKNLKKVFLECHEAVLSINASDDLMLEERKKIGRQIDEVNVKLSKIEEEIAIKNTRLKSIKDVIVNIEQEINTSPEMTK